MLDEKRKFKPLSCGFHSHSDFSLDGGSTANNKLIYAATIDRVADTLTDHGILSGLSTHWLAGQKLKKKGILPKDFLLIQGVEAYIIDPHRPLKPIRKGSKVLVPQYYHLTIHFKNMEAYYYFCKLTRVAEERALLKYGERKPLLTFEEIEGISQHITLGSGCIGGPVQKNVLVGRYELADKMYEYLRNMVGPDNFYVEVFPHIIDHEWKRPEYDKNKKLIKTGSFEPILAPREWEGESAFEAPCTGCYDIQKYPNEYVMALAEKHGDHVIISLDDHYGPAEDKLCQEARLGNGQENWKFFGSYHAKTTEEAAVILQKQLAVSDKTIEKWVDSGYKFIEHFDKYKLPDKNDQLLLPTVEMVYELKYKDKTTTEIFWELVEKHGKMPDADNPKYQEYKDRAEYELKIFTENDSADFMPYFFFCEDICSYARENDIVFTSRGSAGGSLVLFLLGVVITDPIRWGLSFERFLNPGRITGGSLPDVDLDWENRLLIVNYIKDKYGDSFALIASDMKMRLKSSIQDAVRAIKGTVSPEVVALTKSINIPMGVSDDSKWLYGETKDNGEVIPGFIDSNDAVAVKLRSFAKTHPEEWKMVNRCIGVNRQRGVHAGGIVVTPGPVNEFMPVIKQSGKDGEFATAYDMHGVEETGGVKYDILGIKTLDALGISLRALKKDLGVSIPWGPFPEDEEVFESIIKKGKLSGVFQLNTNVAKPFVSRILPKNIIEAAALTALCRPGALDANAPDPDFNGSAAEYYVDCSMGNREPYFIHEDLREILSETHGIAVYQEQLMKIGAKCAGYTEAEADIIIRKGIGKKIEAKIISFSNDLKERLPARGWNDNQISQLINMVMASANYSFNKCLSGDEVIFGHSRTIKEMYNSKIYGTTWSMQDLGIMAKNEIKDIRYEGIKSVFRVTTNSGKNIDVTMNHKFPTPEGELPLSSLYPGDYLYVKIGETAALDKIKSINYLKTDEVYDVEMEGPDHNFTVKSGIVTSNSHSVSYAIVAWNCCYIKHHYPAYYWKGMLTVFGNDNDKLQDMMTECKDRVRNIDVMKSHPTEWAIEDKDYVRMPLNIINGCGAKGVAKLNAFVNYSFSRLAEIKAAETAAKAAKKKV